MNTMACPLTNRISRSFVPMLLVALATLCASALPSWAQLARGVTLTPVTNGLSGTLNLEMNSATCSALVTYSNTQYIAFYKDTAVHLMLGKRTLGTTNWTFNDTGFTPYNNTDGHNTFSLGVDGDGVVHMSWGMHNNPGNYARTTSPGALTATKQSIPFADANITYPRFTHLPDGGLLFDYRAGGGSGNGNHYMNRWSVTNHTWTAVNGTGTGGCFIKGQTTTGLPSGINGDNRNPYINYTMFDSHTNLIVTFNWCEDYNPGPGGEALYYRHDLYFCKSPDYGVTWQRLDGTAYTLPIVATNSSGYTTNSYAEKIWDIPTGHNYINQAGGCVDANDHPYAANWWAPASGSTSPVQQFVVWHNGTSWQAKQLTSRTMAFQTDLATTPSRPLIVCDKQNNLFVIDHDPEDGGKPRVWYCTEPTRQVWQKTYLTSDDMGSILNWEPTYDPVLWKRENKLHLFYQKTATGAGTSPIQVLEFDPAQLLGAPTIANSTASAVGATIATLNGSLSATGLATTAVSVYYGTTDKGQTTAGWDNVVNLGSLGTNAIATPVTGLSPTTTYYYRYYATNSYGVSWGSPAIQFTTLNPLPAISNSPASSVTAATATLNGNLTSVGLDTTTVTVYYGTADQGQTTTGWDGSQSLGVRSVGAVSAGLTGLTGGTTYYYRFYAQNAYGSAWGTPASSFKTLAAPAINNGSGADNIGSTSARLNGSLTAGTLAAVTIYWGDTDGGTAPGSWAHSVSLGVLSEGAFSSSVSGLTMDTNYYYRCYASNAVATAWSASSTNFHTLALTTIRIEAEDYDAGGEGVAYHDDTANNIGGRYRLTEAVDIEGNTDGYHAGMTTNYNVGWFNKNEWMKYTTNIPVTAYYDLTFRVAYPSPYAGYTFHLEVDGTNMTGVMTMPNTGGFQTFTNLTKTNVLITAGTHVLRLVSDTTQQASVGVGNFNWIELTPVVVPTYPRPVITVVPLGGNLSLQVGTVSGATYVLESATSLFPTPDWTPVSTNAGNGGTLTNTVTVSPGTPQSFFRCQVR